MKKATAILLVLTMVLSFGSVAALADDSTGLPEPVDGVITLTCDVTLAAEDQFNGDLTLDLAGYTLTGEVYVSGGTLTVKDSSEAQTGKITRLNVKLNAEDPTGQMGISITIDTEFTNTNENLVIDESI